MSEIDLYRGNIQQGSLVIPQPGGAPVVVNSPEGLRGAGFWEMLKAQSRFNVGVLADMEDLESRIGGGRRRPMARGRGGRGGGRKNTMLLLGAAALPVLGGLVSGGPAGINAPVPGTGGQPPGPPPFPPPFYGFAANNPSDPGPGGYGSQYPGGQAPRQWGGVVYPAQDRTYLAQLMEDDKITSYGFKRLLTPFTLNDAYNLWASSDITDRKTFTALTDGQVPPADVFSFKWHELKNPALIVIADPAGTAASAADQVADYTLVTSTIKVCVPSGSIPVLEFSEWTLIDGQTLPAAIAARTQALSLHLTNHTISAANADGSKTHEFSFAVRNETTGAATLAVAAGVVRWNVGVAIKRDCATC